MKTEKQMAAAAAEFAERWKGRGYERGEKETSQIWLIILPTIISP